MKLSALLSGTALAGGERFPMIQRASPEDPWETFAPTLDDFRAWLVPLLPEWMKGDPGAAGNVAATLAQLKAAAVTNDTMIFDRVTFKWVLGNFTGKADNLNVVQSDHAAITVGAWLRQDGDKIAFQATPTAGVFSIGRKLRESLSVLDVATTSEQIEAILAGESTDDTWMFQQAQEDALEVTVPAATYRILDLEPVAGRTIKGQGRGDAILRLAEGSSMRPINANGVHNFTMENLLLHGNGAAVHDIALFTACQGLRLRRIRATASLGYCINADACLDYDFDDLAFFSTGTLSYAALNLKDPSGPGVGGRIRKVDFRDILGRGIGAFGQQKLQIIGVTGTMQNGEIILFEDCIDFQAFDIDMTGPGAASVIYGGDGLGVNGGCRRGLIMGYTSRFSQGHALSFNGQTGKEGARDIQVIGARIHMPNEGGIIGTDQNVSGSYPQDIRVSDAIVVDAGQKLRSEAFGITGGRNIHFSRTCEARISAGTYRTTFGFVEIAGGSGNVPANNSFEGAINGDYYTARFAIASRTSFVRLPEDDAKVVFDGVGGVDYIGTPYNVDSVVRESDGLYLITLLKPMREDAKIDVNCGFYAGANTGCVYDILSPTQFRVQTMAGTIPNDDDRTSVTVTN